MSHFSFVWIVVRETHFPQLSPRSAEVDSARPFNFSKTRFDHLHRDHIVTEGLLPQRPANAPALCVFCARQLLVGPQDALRPNQSFYFLHFCPARANNAFSPADRLLCWVDTLLHSTIQNQAYILPCSSQISTRKAKGLGLKMTRKRSFDGRDDGMCLERDDIQLLLLDLERSGENFTGRAWIARIPAFPSPLL